MPSIMDQQFGLYSQSLKVHGKRNELIADNLANADTPGYQAKDIDFKAVLSGVQDSRSTLNMQRTNQRHIQPMNQMADLEHVKYRMPTHPALDGNTVDTQLEKTAFAENAVRYQVTLGFMNSRITGLINAFKGE